jgi:hypothetical protein
MRAERWLADTMRSRRSRTAAKADESLSLSAIRLRSRLIQASYGATQNCVSTTAHLPPGFDRRIQRRDDPR